MTALLPFRALVTIEPFGVLSFDPLDGFRLWRWRQWLHHRGGNRAHYDDLAATRTIVVDHLEFCPGERSGLGRDELGRVTASVTLAMAFGIVFSHDDGVDGAYLHRCFGHDEARRIMDAVHALARELKRDLLPLCKGTADVNASIIHRSNEVLVMR